MRFLTPVEARDAVADRLHRISGQAEVTEAVRLWESSATESERERAFLGVAEALASTGLTSDVRFRTSLEGAKVKYQLISRHVAQEVFEATNDSRVPNLPIGYYLVWTERDGRATSTKCRYSIIDPEPPPILLTEDIP